jgi:hypothetical protein
MDQRDMAMEVELEFSRLTHMLGTMTRLLQNPNY